MVFVLLKRISSNNPSIFSVDFNDNTCYEYVGKKQKLDTLIPTFNRKLDNDLSLRTRYLKFTLFLHRVIKAYFMLYRIVAVSDEEIQYLAIISVDANP